MELPFGIMHFTRVRKRWLCEIVLPNLYGAQSFDLFNERLLPGVHLYEPDRVEYLVHESHSLVGCDYGATTNDRAHFRNHSLIVNQF